MDLRLPHRWFLLLLLGLQGCAEKPPDTAEVAPPWATPHWADFHDAIRAQSCVGSDPIGPAREKWLAGSRALKLAMTEATLAATASLLRPVPGMFGRQIATAGGACGDFVDDPEIRALQAVRRLRCLEEEPVSAQHLGALFAQSCRKLGVSVEAVHALVRREGQDPRFVAALQERRAPCSPVAVQDLAPADAAERPEAGVRFVGRLFGDRMGDVVLTIGPGMDHSGEVRVAGERIPVVARFTPGGGMRMEGEESGPPLLFDGQDKGAGHLAGHWWIGSPGDRHRGTFVMKAQPDMPR